MIEWIVGHLWESIGIAAGVGLLLGFIVGRRSKGAVNLKSLNNSAKRIAAAIERTNSENRKIQG